MKKYKYKSLLSNTLVYDLDLDKIGQEGWELVSFAIIERPTKFLYIFKQEIPIAS